MQEVCELEWSNHALERWYERCGPDSPPWEIDTRTEARVVKTKRTVLRKGLGLGFNLFFYVNDEEIKIVARGDIGPDGTISKFLVVTVMPVQNPLSAIKDLF